MTNDITIAYNCLFLIPISTLALLYVKKKFEVAINVFKKVQNTTSLPLFRIDKAHLFAGVSKY